MAEMTPALNWGALGLLFVVLCGIGLGLREWYRKIEEREFRRMELADARERERIQAQAQAEEREVKRRREDIAWLRELVTTIQAGQQEQAATFQRIADEAVAAQQQVAEALTRLTMEFSTHEERAQNRYETLLGHIAAAQQ